MATAQRLAKLELMRRRQQGTGTFQFNLYGVQMAVLDVVAMTLPFFTWAQKLLEIVAWRFTPVSYTHLDVYKRQVLNNTQGLFRLKANSRKYSMLSNRTYGLQFDIREAL